MALKKIARGLKTDNLPAQGLLYQDEEALTKCQVECSKRLNLTVQLEQEAYLSQHPEVIAMLEIFLAKVAQSSNRKGILKAAAEHFTRPAEVLEQEVREKLGLPPEGPFVMEDPKPFKYFDWDLEKDLKAIILKSYPTPEWKIPSPVIRTPDTESSIFVSLQTSETTLPTPEPIPTPEPTLEEILYTAISNTVDKAIYLHVDDIMLRYDTAYVELTKAVEEAMEIPVMEIKEDIAEMYWQAYENFELEINEKERIAAEIAWEKRMRKKLKRTLRRMNNFKGYETPPTPKSELSSHPSYLKPPQRPCECHPQFHYNRYTKDRFGIYLPLETEYPDENVTATPAISISSDDDDGNDKIDTKSVVSKKSVASTKAT